MRQTGGQRPQSRVGEGLQSLSRREAPLYSAQREPAACVQSLCWLVLLRQAQLV